MQLNLLVAGSNSSHKRMSCADTCDAAVIATQQHLNTLADASEQGLHPIYNPTSHVCCDRPEQQSCMSSPMVVTPFTVCLLPITIFMSAICA